MARMNGQRSDEDLDETDLDADEADTDTDEESDEDEDDHEEQDGEEQDGTDDTEKGGFDEAKLLAKVESRIDRRLNAVLREIRKGQGGSPAQRQKQADGGQQTGSGVDLRSARLAYREYVGDAVKFVSTVERQAAAKLANGLIAEKIASGEDDEDVIGAEVAETVAETILGLRKHYEERSRAGLRRQGALPDPKRGQGGNEGKGTASKLSGELKRGAELAASRHRRPGA